MERGPTAADRRALRILWFGQFTAIAGLTVVVPLLPFYLAGLGLPNSEVAWWTAVSLAAPAITQLATAPLWGMVGDRFGHKAMVVRAYAGLAVAVGLMALADTPEEFLLCRLLQGGFGGVVGATATYASTVAAPERRGRALGGLFGATGAGSLLGPLAGSLLAGRFGFGALFGIVAVLLLTASLLALAMLPRSERPRTETAGDRGRPALRRVIGQIATDPRLRTLVLAGLLGQASIFALVVVFAPRVDQLTSSLSSAIVWVGALQATTWAASLLGGPWWGRRNDRKAARSTFAIAASACALAVALQGLAATPEFLVLLRIVQGFCFAALAQSVLYVICHVAPDEARGTALGTTNGLLDMGQVAGPMLGALAASLLPPSATFAAIGAMLLTAACLAALGTVRRQVRHRPRAALAAPSHSR